MKGQSSTEPQVTTDFMSTWLELLTIFAESVPVIICPTRNGFGFTLDLSWGLQCWIGRKRTYQNNWYRWNLWSTSHHISLLYKTLEGCSNGSHCGVTRGNATPLWNTARDPIAVSSYLIRGRGCDFPARVSQFSLTHWQLYGQLVMPKK